MISWAISLCDVFVDDAENVKKIQITVFQSIYLHINDDARKTLRKCCETGCKRVGQLKTPSSSF